MGSLEPHASLRGVVIIVLMVMVINLIVDISYAFLDPRIRYGRAAK